MVMGASQASGKAIMLGVVNVGAEAVLHGDERGTPTSASQSTRVCIETRWLLHGRGKPPGSDMIRHGSELVTLPP
jgi:hypothetical protein